MSGEVIRLNDDDEDDDDQDDEDVAELLARTNDDDDEIDLDNGHSRLNGNRGNNASGMSRFRKGLNQTGGIGRGGMKIGWSKNLKAGSVAQFLNTMTLCAIFFGMGLTKSLINLQVEMERKEGPSPKETANSVGYVVGFVFGGIMLSRFSRSFILLIVMFVLSWSLFVVPWTGTVTSSIWLTNVVYSIIGICSAILMIGGNIICLDFWGRKCGPFIYALHFSLSLGLLVGPFVIEPLAQTHVPKMVQNIALPKSLQENTTSVETVVATTKAYHDLYKHHHKIIKRGISNLKFLNESHAMASKHPQRIPSIPKLKTPDPLLAKLFATTNIMQKSRKEIPHEQKSEAKKSKPSNIPASKPVKRPKPVFTDGRKLDNSIDWETVKIAKPPPEDLSESAITTSPSTPDTILTTSHSANDTMDPLRSIKSKSMRKLEIIRKELDGLQQDIEQSERIKEWLKNGGEDELVRGTRKLSTYINTPLRRVKRSGINTNIGYDVRPNQWHGRQPHLPRPNIPIEQLRPYSSQDVGYSRPRIHGPKLDDWRLLDDGNPGSIEYDGRSIDNIEYPNYGERSSIYVQEPARIIPINTSPPPKEVQSAISLLKDYWIGGDDALKKHKTTVENPNKGDNETSQVNSKNETPTQPTVHDIKSTSVSTTKRILTSTTTKLSPKSPSTTSSIPIETSKVPSLIKTQKDPLSQKKNKSITTPSVDETHLFDSTNDRHEDIDYIEDHSFEKSDTYKIKKPDLFTKTKSNRTKKNKKKKPKKHHRKKPTLSYDNDTDISMKGFDRNYLESDTSLTGQSLQNDNSKGNNVDPNRVTIGSVLHKYGVSHSHVGFVLDATYTFILALVQLMCMCYYKRSGMPAGVEPLPRISRYGSSRIPHEMMRRRQEYSSASSLSLTSLDSWGHGEENRIFKATMTVLLFFFNLLHWSCFVSLSQGLPHIDALRAESQQQTFEKLHSVLPTHSLHQVFLGVFTISRVFWILSSMCFRRSIFRPDVAIFSSLLFTLIGSSLFVSSQGLIDLSKYVSARLYSTLGSLSSKEEVPSHLSDSGISLWVGIVMQAIGLSSLLPSSIIWAETYMIISSQIIALICWGLSLAELVARPDLFAILLSSPSTSGLFQGGSAESFGYNESRLLAVCVLVASLMCTGVFVCVFFIARRQGNRFKDPCPQASGYELANQDENTPAAGNHIGDEEDGLVEENLEDEDDFEVSSSTLNEKEHRGLMRLRSSSGENDLA